jgi:NADPH:quinone reductase-like Zn-dependent oxidoreductase
MTKEPVRPFSAFELRMVTHVITGLFVTWPTSYEALVGRANLKPGEWVLVLASAGGVGISAVQIAKGVAQCYHHLRV